MPGFRGTYLTVNVQLYSQGKSYNCEIKLEDRSSGVMHIIRISCLDTIVQYDSMLQTYTENIRNFCLG